MHEAEWEEEEAHSLFFSHTIASYTMFINLSLACIVLAHKFLKSKLAGDPRSPPTSPTLSAPPEAQHQLTYWLSVISIGVGFWAVFLVPLSIVTEAFRQSSDSERDDSFLHPRIIKGLWQILFNASNICNFGVVPFAYLYSEAVGIFRHRGTAGRLLETAGVLCLILLLARLFLHLVQAITGVENLTLSYHLSSFVGSLFFLVFAPFGFVWMFQAAIHQVMPVDGNMTASERALVLDAEIASIVARLALAETSEEREELKDDLYQAQVSRAQLQNRMLADYPRLRQILALPLACLSLLLPLLVLLRLLSHQILGPFERYLSGGTTSAKWLSLSLLDAALTLYLWFGTMFGTHNTPYVQDWMSEAVDQYNVVGTMLMHAFLCLLMGTSFPLVAWNLGLTNFDDALWSGDVEVFRHAHVGSTFALVFAIAMLVALWRSVAGVQRLRAPRAKEE